MPRIAFAAFLLIALPAFADEKPRFAGPTGNGFLLPNGWHITPAGEQVETADTSAAAPVETEAQDAPERYAPSASHHAPVRPPLAGRPIMPPIGGQPVARHEAPRPAPPASPAPPPAPAAPPPAPAATPGPAAPSAVIAPGRPVPAPARPIPGAAVTLVSQTGSAGGATITDSSGAYRFQGLPEGTYLIRAEAPGFASFLLPLARRSLGEGGLIFTSHFRSLLPFPLRHPRFLVCHSSFHFSEFLTS